MKKFLFTLSILCGFTFYLSSQNSDEGNSMTRDQILNLSATLNAPAPANVIEGVINAAYVRTALGHPWGTNTNDLAMDAVFGAGMWSDLRFETVDPAVLFSSQYKFIFMEGGAEAGPILETFVNANKTLIENWVSNSNRLLITGSSYSDLGDLVLTPFGGFAFNNFQNNSNQVIAADPSHAIFNGPALPVGLTFSGSSFAHGPVTMSTVTPVTLITDAGNPGYKVLVEFDWNGGTVMLGDITTTSFHSPQPNAFNLRVNMIYYLYNLTKIDAGEDVMICKGSSTQLNATGAPAFTWSPSAGLSATDIPNPVASPDVTTTYTVTGYIPCTELLANPGFEEGATGFSTEYTVSSTTYPAGSCGVGYDAHTFHQDFYGTARTGSNMMVVNGAVDAGKVVWEQTIGVADGYDFVFSLWTMQLDGQNEDPLLQLKINGVDVGAAYRVESHSWTSFTRSWTASGTTAKIQIIDLNLSGGDNDFALDDASFKYSPCGVLGTDEVVVTVDDVDPVITLCAENWVQYATTTACEAAILDKTGTVSGTDNCGIQSITQSPEPGTLLGEGDHIVTFTITDTNNNTAECTATLTIKKRPTTLTYAGETWKDYSDVVSMKALLVDDLTATGIPGMEITFTIGTQSTTGITNGYGVAYADIKLDQPAGLYTIVTEFAGKCPYQAAYDKDPFKITKEWACATYSGVRIASTGSTTSNVAKVLLAATITDWPDGMPGDLLANAQVNFVRATATFPFREVIAGPLNIGMITEGDHTIGSVNAWWTVTLSSTALWQTNLVWVEVIGDYYFNWGKCLDQTLITVYRPGPEFITGGGYLILEKPAGTFGADVGSKNNFGFNVKYNRKGTTLQGNINTIIRKTVDGEELVYHVKGNKMGSLSVLKNFAVFTCQASIVDITDPELPKDVMGNCTMKVNMIDNGEPGNSDMIGITVFDKDGGMYYSSRWEKNETQMQLLGNGNLAVHGSLKSGEPLQVDTPAEVSLVVYPNPFTDQLRFEFIAPGDSRARIDLFDVTGRMVATVFDSAVEAGVEYQAEFRPGARVSGMYLYRATIGDRVYNGKVNYQR